MPSISTPLPKNEQQRVELLHLLDVLDGPSEPLYDDVAELAASICNMPIAAISLIDTDRQWFKAKVGISQTELPRNEAFCAHTILHGDRLLEVEDAQQDERFSTSSFVTGNPGVRFYAGAPIVMSTGDVIGAVCVLGLRPARLTEDQRRALLALGRQTASNFELRRRSLEAESAARDADRLARRHAQLLSTSTDAIFVLDDNFRVLEASDSFAELLGVTLTAALSMRPWDWDALYDTQEKVSARRAARGRQAHSFDTVWRRSDGSTRDVSIAHTCADGPEGPVAHLVARDVSEARRADRVQAGIVRLQQSIANSTMGVNEIRDVMVARARELTRADGATIFSLKADDLVCVASAGATGKSLGSRVRSSESFAALAIASGGIVRCDDLTADQSDNLQGLRRAGALSAIAAPLWIGRSAVGAMVLSSAAARGFTQHEEATLQIMAEWMSMVMQRNAATKRLQQSEEQYRLVFATSPLPMWIYDVQTMGFLAVNESATRQYGYSNEEFLDMRLGDIRPHDEVDRLLGYLAIRDPFETTAGCWRHRRRDGTLIEVEVSSNQITFAGRSARMVLAQDVTEQRVAQRALKQLNENLEAIVASRTSELEASRVLAEEASRAKSAFVATMSHEIRTPLNGVVGMVDLMSRTQLNDKQRSYLSVARDSADSLLHIVNDVLDFSKVEAGKLELEIQAVDIADLTQRVGRMFSEGHPNLDLSTVVNAELPDWVMADESRVRQILVNLVGNAVKFSSRTERLPVVSLNAKASSRSGPTVWLEISVTDNGIGISEQAQRSIFESFSQAHSAITREFGGTGLGLAIAQRLVRLRGGTLGVQSELGQGATFTVHLPCEVCAAGSSARPAGGGPLRTLPTDCVVLVAEDNEFNQLLIGEQLRHLGVGFEIASDGQVALAKWQSKHYDMLITDLQMPVVDGYALVSAIRAVERSHGQRSPIVALTANASSEERNRCLDIGMDDYLTKPLLFACLQKMLETWLPLTAEMA